MPEIIEKVKSFYSLDLLATLDPRDNRDMAEIIIGTYIVNARAKQQTKDFADSLRFKSEREKRSWVTTCNLLERVDNLHKITDLIGQRAIRAVDISDGGEPIHYQGFSVVNEASGIIGKNSVGNRMISTPDHSSGQMKLVTPRSLFHRSDDWHAVKIAEDSQDFAPLVELTVADSMRSFR